jgi:hypothetical protein
VKPVFFFRILCCFFLNNKKGARQKKMNTHTHRGMNKRKRRERVLLSSVEELHSQQVWDLEFEVFATPVNMVLLSKRLLRLPNRECAYNHVVVKYKRRLFRFKCSEDKLYWSWPTRDDLLLGCLEVSRDSPGHKDNDVLEINFLSSTELSENMRDLPKGQSGGAFLLNFATELAKASGLKRIVLEDHSVVPVNNSATTENANPHYRSVPLWLLRLTQGKSSWYTDHGFLHDHFAEVCFLESVVVKWFSSYMKLNGIFRADLLKDKPGSMELRLRMIDVFQLSPEWKYWTQLRDAHCKMTARI